MSLPKMSIINFTSTLNDRDIQAPIRAVNRQVKEDFAPIWGAAYDLILHASHFDPIKTASIPEEIIRGDAVMYLVDTETVQGALGYHALNSHGMPVGFVFVLDTDDWTATLSHEVLELIIDPTVNVMVPGPDPRDPDNIVLHTYEVCDAVERTSYMIDDIEVSNFITQSWFTPGDELGTRNDFLGVGVKSFNATKDSHLAFFNLATNQWDTFLGLEAPSATLVGKREAICYRDIPRRNDEVIQNAFDLYKKSVDTDPLPYLHGLTRTARYKVRTREWFGLNNIVRKAA